MPLKILYNETLQAFFLKKAINELLSDYDNLEEKNIIKKINIKIDHLYGINYINDNKKLPIIFPLYIKDYIFNIKKEKTIDYNFIGKITIHRNWIEKYNSTNSYIDNNNNGRDVSIKYNIDTKYYDILCKSKFTLTPTGDCPWSYRFFEAIMCLSIPILENNSNDIYMKNYFCYFDNDTHIYYEDKAIDNYNKFINSEHFLKNDLFKNTCEENIY
jgi:hypothetical protein